MDPDKFQIMLDEYYYKHGWNIKTGLQEADPLKEMGADEIVSYLEENGIMNH